MPQVVSNGKSNVQQAATLTYVAVGASDAFGVGTGDPSHDNWPTVLSHDLGGSVHLVNLGIPGITVEGARRGATRRHRLASRYRDRLARR